MKAFFSVLVVLAMVSPLCATVVVQEDFDGTGAAAGSTINGYNGWSGNDTMVFSDTVIDSGLSAGATTGANWPNVQKGFSYTPGSHDAYTLIATLRVTDANQYASAELTEGGLMPFYASVGGGSSVVQFGYYSDPDYNNLTFVDGAYTVGAVVDVKAVLTNGNADCYVRTHGASAWNLVGSVVDAGITIADFNGAKVSNKAKDGYIGGLTDSIQLTCGPVPEPSSIVLTLVGLFGLLAYAWRKRK